MIEPYLQSGKFSGDPCFKPQEDKPARSETGNVIYSLCRRLGEHSPLCLLREHGSH